jgi:rhodanese-related sulfurtransferase
MAMGYKNVSCLKGGVEAWKRAGFAVVSSEWFGLF